MQKLTFEFEHSECILLRVPLFVVQGEYVGSLLGESCNGISLYDVLGKDARYDDTYTKQIMICIMCILYR